MSDHKSEEIANNKIESLNILAFCNNHYYLIKNIGILTNNQILSTIQKT